MCALSPCCKANCNNVIVATGTSDQLSNMNEGKNCFTIGTQTIKSGNTNILIEAYRKRSGKPFQKVNRPDYNEFEENKQKQRNKKNPGIDRLTFNPIWTGVFLGQS